MAALLSSSVARNAILRLPPHLRVSAYQHSLSRSFSASTPRKLSLVDIAVAPPTYLLNTLHNAGLPWYAILPTAAVLVRGVFVYYFSILPGRKAAQIQSHLMPLAAVNAIQSHNTPEKRRERRKLPPLFARLSDVMGKAMALQQEQHRLGKAFGAPKWRWRGLLNFGMLIAMTESIRMKCAAREGLLPLVVSPFQWIGRSLRPDLYPPPPPELSQEEKDGKLREMMEQAATMDESGDLQYDFTKLPKVEAEREYSAYFDPSLQEEGISWWCMDLTVPDPTLMLPIMLGLGVATNILSRPTAAAARPPGPLAPSKPTTEPSLDLDGANRKAQMTLQAPHYEPKKFLGFLPPITNLQRIGLVLAMGFSFAALKMPAAILLYFIPSLVVGWVQNRWLDAKYPIRTPIGPCARPLRMRVRREWSD